MRFVEITGWDSEGESVDGSQYVNPGETDEQAIARLREKWDIVEIGDLRVYDLRYES